MFGLFIAAYLFMLAQWHFCMIVFPDPEGI